MPKGLALLEEAHAKASLPALWALTKYYYEAGDSPHLFPLLDEGVARLLSPSMALMTWELNGNIPSPLGSGSVQADNAWLTVYMRGALCGEPTTSTYVAVQLGKANPPDLPLARFLLHRAARKGCIEAQAVLAAALITGEFGLTTDLDRGKAELERLASLQTSPSDSPEKMEPAIGRAEAQWQLGHLLFEGRYLPGNKARGLDLIKEAAASQNPAAKMWLATNQG